MFKKFFRMLKDERGVTALETAIILIAFVVVAAVFAFTILTTGTFLTEKSKEAAYAGLKEVQSSMELKGSVVLETTGANVVFNVAVVAGGASMDLTQIKMAYRDVDENADIAFLAGATTPTNAQWIATNSAGTTAVTILAAGSLAKINVKLTNAIVANQQFGLELRPPYGGVLLFERTAPALITAVTDLK